MAGLAMERAAGAASAAMEARALWTGRRGARRYPGSVFTRRAEVKAMMDPARIALVLGRPALGHRLDPIEMLQDGVLAEIRSRLGGMADCRGHWSYALNRHRALINAYLAVRWARLLARQAIRDTAAQVLEASGSERPIRNQEDLSRSQEGLDNETL